jgi:hypothetical protein
MVTTDYTLVPERDAIPDEWSDALIINYRGKNEIPQDLAHQGASRPQSVLSRRNLYRQSGLLHHCSYLTIRPPGLVMQGTGKVWILHEPV